MKILGYEVIKGDAIKSLQSKAKDIEMKYETISKSLKEYQSLMPDADERFRLGSSDSVQIPVYPLPEAYIYTIAMQSDIYRTIINTLRDRVFRRGLKIREKSLVPNQEQLEKIEKFKKKINEVQSMFDLLKQFEQDVCIMDNGYIIAIKDYWVDANGQIIGSDTKEFARGSPQKMRIIADRQGRRGYNEDGKKIYTSLGDRTQICNEEQATKNNFIDPKTGKAWVPAAYRSELDSGKYIYYMEDEVLHVARFNPTMLYGYPPMLAIWMKIVTLIEMDRYLMLAYQKQRPPRGLLTISTNNFDSVKKAWENLKAETRKDPHSINPLIMQTPDPSKNQVQFLDFLKGLDEMQYIESRNEMRRQIGAIYGVMPLFSGDIQSSGGLNNESQQTEVTTQAIEEAQKVYNDKVLPFICNSLNITDYELLLEEPEEADEMEDVKRLGLKIDNAQKMKSMGFEVKFNPAEEKFSFSEQAVIPITTPSNQTIPQQFQKSEMSPVQIRNLIKKACDVIRSDIENDIKKAISPQLLQSEELVDNLWESFWNKRFDGIDKPTSDKIKEFVLNTILERGDLQSLISQIKAQGITEEQAETIARTETQAIQNKVREFNYMQADPENEYRYKWIGPTDDRTSNICQEIADKTSSGISLKELKEVLAKTAAKYGIEAREFTPHPNCRHTFVRVV